MATINEIKQQAAAVKNATQVGENTADRVGGALAGLADIAEQQNSKLSDLDTELGKKANKADMDVELAKKFDKESVAQESGDSEELVMSQKAINAALGKKANAEEVNNSMQELDNKLNRNLLAIEFDDETGDLNAIIGQDSTISSVSTDDDGNVIIEQEII